jgi:hypothetical protein
MVPGVVKSAQLQLIVPKEWTITRMYHQEAHEKRENGSNGALGG